MLQARTELDAYLTSNAAIQKVRKQRGKVWPAMRHKAPTRGIVIPSGGAVLVTNAYVTLRVLRDVVNCTLPIEIMYNGDHEIDNVTRTYLQERFSDLRIVDVSTLPYPQHHNPVKLTRFLFKAYAFYQSSFDQIMLMDSDCMPLRDPTYLFETKGFQEAGNLFLPDFWKSRFPNEAYEVFGLPVPQPGKNFDYTTESGMVLFDKRRYPDITEWIWFLNAYGPDGIYRYMWGDKDTFQLAFSLAGEAASFRQILSKPRDGLSATREASVAYPHVGMVHSDPEGHIILLHRTNRGKFNPSSDSFWSLDYVTIPLCEARSEHLQHSPQEGGFGFFEQHVDKQTAQTCKFKHGDTFHTECKLDVESTELPVPIIPISKFAKGIVRVLQTSYAAFGEIKADIANGTILANACKEYDMTWDRTQCSD